MKATDYLSRQELQAFTRRSDLMGAAMIAWNWVLIAAIFALVATWTNPLTVVLGVLFLGGRQLGLAVIMHESGHKTLCNSPRLNDLLGQWLAAYPILGDCDAYGSSHREHHRLAGTRDDPDLPNYERYPVDKASFRRKLWRDVTGQTGMKLLVGVLSGAGNRIMMRDKEGTGSVPQGLLANLILLGLLWAAGEPALYLLWVAAYLTSYPLVARIRQVAEHGNVPGLYDPDPRDNTRTTRANLLEQMLLCPNGVNYHIEHHLLPSVPAWRLKALHSTLRQRGFYEDYPRAIATGYWDVIKRAVPELDPAPSAAS